MCRLLLASASLLAFAFCTASTLCTPEIIGQERKKSPEPAKEGKPVHSKLYRALEPAGLRKTCERHFERIHGSGSRTIQLTLSPDWYKMFDVEGTISEDKLKGLFGDLKTELHKMAKASGVAKVGQPDDRIEERPLSVVRAMYSGRLIRPGSLRGFHLIYSDGKIVGAIDVIAARNSDALDRWELVCAVHEVVPE